MTQSIHQAAAAALFLNDPDEKCEAVMAMRAAWDEGTLPVFPGPNDPHPVPDPGRPVRPELVPPQNVPQRKIVTPEGHAAMLHSITHIEFNAINLALDCVLRFRALPDEFHGDWLRVAAEEVQHFRMVRERLRSLGHDYGSFPAHNGLWEMACKSAHDPLIRMALVPRLLEARGLDANPAIAGKLRAIDDLESVTVLESLLHDEIGHVFLGDKWFRRLCAERGLEPEQTYRELIEAFDAPRPRPPLHREARLSAGFSSEELASFGLEK